MSEKPPEKVNAITTLCNIKFIDENDELESPKAKSDERKEESKPCEEEKCPTFEFLSESVQVDNCKQEFEELPTSSRAKLSPRLRIPNLKSKPLLKNCKYVSLGSSDIFLGNGRRLKILDKLFHLFSVF